MCNCDGGMHEGGACVLPQPVWHVAHMLGMFVLIFLVQACARSPGCAYPCSNTSRDPRSLACPAVAQLCKQCVQVRPRASASYQLLTGPPMADYALQVFDPLLMWMREHMGWNMHASDSIFGTTQSDETVAKAREMLKGEWAVQRFHSATR